jgi:hypothetical protein
LYWLKGRNPLRRPRGIAPADESHEKGKRFAEMLKSAARQIISVFLIFFGALLALNVSVGPCGGTALAVEPFPAIFVAILGFELMVCSYFLVKNLKVESDFRVVIYLFLGMWSLSLVMAAVMLGKAGTPPAREDIDDFYFSLLRGLAALVNLVLFYRWAGAKKNDYQTILIPSPFALPLEFQSHIISWRLDTESRGLFQA